MKFNFNRDKCPLWGTGLSNRLDMLTAIIEKWKINPEVFFYDREGKNRWNDIFTIDLDDTYSKTKSIIIKKVYGEKNYYVEERPEHVYLEKFENEHSLPFSLFEYHDTIKNRFRFTENFLKEVDILYDDLGMPTVGLFIRETDKMDGNSNLLQRTPISSRMVYDRIKELGLDKEVILVISGSLLTINYLLEKGLDVVYHQKHKSATIFPNHLWSKISRFYPDNSGEYDFFVDHEFQMGYEFLLEMGIMLKLDPTKVFQTIFQGPCLMYHYLNHPLVVKDLIDVDDISLREKEIINYHQHRESILWLTLYGLLLHYSMEERF